MKIFIKLILSGIFALFQFQITTQDGRVVKGQVTDQSGKPLTGDSVLIKGTKAGTFTNENGNFSIEASVGHTLVFSSVSYESKEVKIINTTVNLKLTLQVTELEKVMISGNMVASKRKADIHSVTELSAKDLEEHPGFQLQLAQIYGYWRRYAA